MFCSPKPEDLPSFEDDVADTTPRSCGMYDPNRDNNTQPSVSVTRVGLGFGAVVNEDGSVCIMLGVFGSFPLISPSFNLGGLSE
jgi:hypothetical protein